MDPSDRHRSLSLPLPLVLSPGWTPWAQSKALSPAIDPGSVSFSSWLDLPDGCWPWLTPLPCWWLEWTLLTLRSGHHAQTLQDSACRWGHHQCQVTSVASFLALRLLLLPEFQTSELVCTLLVASNFLYNRKKPKILMWIWEKIPVLKALDKTLRDSSNLAKKSFGSIDYATGNSQKC